MDGHKDDVNTASSDTAPAKLGSYSRLSADGNKDGLKATGSPTVEDS